MIIYQKAFPFCNSPVDSTNEPLNSFFPFLSPIANIFLMKDWKQRRKRKIFNDINFKKLQKLVPLFCKIKRWEQIQENKQPNNTLGFRKKKWEERERKSIEDSFTFFLESCFLRVIADIAISHQCHWPKSKIYSQKEKKKIEVNINGSDIMTNNSCRSQECQENQFTCHPKWTEQNNNDLMKQKKLKKSKETRTLPQNEAKTQN